MSKEGLPPGKKGILTIEDKKYEILEYEQDFSAPSGGAPYSKERKFVNIIFATPGDADLSFQQWLESKGQQKDAQIELYIDREAKDKTKTVLLKNATCVNLYEYFNYDNSVLMYTKITLMTTEIKMGKGNDEGKSAVA